MNNKIMNESRHQFIFCLNDENRNLLLKNIQSNYPITQNNNRPIAIYMGEFSLPYINGNLTPDNKYLIYPIAREYLNFSIAYNLIEKVLNTKDIELINNKSQILINRINKLFKNKNYKDIETLEELLNILSEVRNFYKVSYEKLFTDNINSINIDSLPIPFIELNSFIDYYKQMLNIKSFIALIFDYRNSMPIISHMAINSLVTRRINQDISIKVVCEIDEWKTYYDLNGILAQRTHDYGTIELYNKHNVKKLIINTQN